MFDKKNLSEKAGDLETGRGHEDDRVHREIGGSKLKISPNKIVGKAHTKINHDLENILLSKEGKTLGHGKKCTLRTFVAFKPDTATSAECRKNRIGHGRERQKPY